MNYTITQNAEYELVEKKSKFIANAIYVESKEDAENKLNIIKKKYHDARHNCYAYRILEDDKISERSSDDGEPSGTAGGPMLNILQKNDLCNVLVVVTRYFGGILLGTGGLVRAYSGATLGALSLCNKIQIIQGSEFEVQLDYTDFQEFNYYCQKNSINIINSEYGENVVCNIEMTKEIKEKFLRDINEQKLILKNVKEVQKKYIKIS